MLCQPVGYQGIPVVHSSTEMLQHYKRYALLTTKAPVGVSNAVCIDVAIRCRLVRVHNGAPCMSSVVWGRWCNGLPFNPAPVALLPVQMSCAMDGIRSDR